MQVLELCFKSEIMNKIVSTISFLLLINTCLMSQANIDFNPKSLKVELTKVNSKEVELKELSIAPELAGNIRLGKFYSITNQSFSLTKYVYIGRINTCRAGGCSIKQNTKTNQDSEFFDYFIFFDANASIQLVKIFNYQASHGQEVTATSWLKQFKNYDGKKELVVGKNVDAISGATISVDATSLDIEHKTKLLKKILQ